MGDTTIVRAKLTGMIRPEGGGSRFMVKRGVTTAHAGAEIVKSHPHLWEPIAVDFPVEGAELTDAAVEAAGTSHTEALRAILSGLESRGYELRAASEDQVPDQLVALVFSAIDHPRGERPERGEARPFSLVGPAHAHADAPCTAECYSPVPVDGDLRRTDAGQLQEWGAGAWHDVAEPPAGDEVSMPAPGDPGTHDLDDDPEDEVVTVRTVDQTPHDAVDPATKEGRAAIRDWAGSHGFDVAASGPIRQEVIDAWWADQRGQV